MNLMTNINDPSQAIPPHQRHSERVDLAHKLRVAASLPEGPRSQALRDIGQMTVLLRRQGQQSPDTEEMPLWLLLVLLYLYPRESQSAARPLAAGPQSQAPDLSQLRVVLRMQGKHSTDTEEMPLWLLLKLLHLYPQEPQGAASPPNENPHGVADSGGHASVPTDPQTVQTGTLRASKVSAAHTLVPGDGASVPQRTVGDLAPTLLVTPTATNQADPIAAATSAAPLPRQVSAASPLVVPNAAPLLLSTSPATSDPSATPHAGLYPPATAIPPASTTASEIATSGVGAMSHPAASGATLITAPSVPLAAAPAPVNAAMPSIGAATSSDFAATQESAVTGGGHALTQQSTTQLEPDRSTNALLLEILRRVEGLDERFPMPSQHLYGRPAHECHDDATTPCVRARGGAHDSAKNRPLRGPQAPFRRPGGTEHMLLNGVEIHMQGAVESLLTRDPRLQQGPLDDPGTMNRMTLYPAPSSHRRPGGPATTREHLKAVRPSDTVRAKVTHSLRRLGLTPKRGSNP